MQLMFGPLLNDLLRGWLVSGNELDLVAILVAAFMQAPGKQPT